MATVVRTLKERAELIKALRSAARHDVNPNLSRSFVTRPAISVRDELTERERIKNRSLAQDIDLKRQSLLILFYFLAAETAVIFAYAFLQGTHIWNFALEEWSFKLLVTVTIMQITYMLQIAIKHLFPKD